VKSRVQLGSKSNRSSSEFLLLFCIIYFVINMYQGSCVAVSEVCVAVLTGNECVFSVCAALNSDHYSTSTGFYVALTLVIVTFAWNLFFALSLHRSLLADTKVRCS
jgi:hypothetical protein